MRLPWALMLIATAVIAHRAEAASLRCGAELVSDGATRDEVLRKCGQPTSQQTRTVYETVGARSAQGEFARREVQHVIEEWVYSVGPNALDQFVTFEDGRLTDVRSGNYGR